MRNPKSIIGVVIIVGIVFYLINTLLSGQKNEDEYGMVLPNISSITFDGTLFELSKLEEVNTTVVFFFSPDCEHCEEEIKGLLDNKSIIEKENVRWIFITVDILNNELSLFLKSFPMDKLTNAFVLLDKGLLYHNMFEVSGSPYVFVFDESQRLVHKIVGGFEVDTLINWL